MKEDDSLLTFKETMARLRVSRSTIFRMIAIGDLKAHKVGNGLRFYDSDVKNAVRVREVGNQVQPIDTEGN